MGERLRLVSFKQFRGLPSFACDVKGKNLAILGGNGRGKSAIVDGIEFAFRGYLSRFRGQGTGSIDDQVVLRHLKATKSPIVELAFMPSNETVRRTAKTEGTLSAKHPSLAKFLEEHPPVDSFVLRRNQLLNFINAQNAKRYEMFVDLLGLEDLSLTQRAFNEVADRSSQALETLRSERARLLAEFAVADPPLTPTSTDEIRRHLSKLSEEQGGQRLDTWNDVERVLGDLKSHRSSEHGEEIDLLNRAIVTFDQDVPARIPELVDAFNSALRKVKSLKGQSAEAERSSVITSGQRYFTDNPKDQTCPLCERPLDVSVEGLLARLTVRLESLTEYQAAVRDAVERIRALRRAASTLGDLLQQDEKQDQQLNDELRAALSRLHTATRAWLDGLPREDPEAWGDEVPTFKVLLDLNEARKQARGYCSERKKALIPENQGALESAIQLFQQASRHRERLASIEADINRAAVVVDRASKAREAFTRAREAAVQSVFDSIASKVLAYYRALHDDQDIDVCECERVSLTPTSRAAGGGLRLAIDFLTKANVDPRGYLSEGHLDSLGLCIYLATVKTFNMPGSLLVLDDVLTSIDAEHRHRVRDLLLAEFEQFQIVITTHDEYWFDQIQDGVRARGEDKAWRFLRLANWTLDGGPETAALETTWQFIDSNLSEPEYRELGGALRLVTEDCLKRIAERMRLSVTYRRDGRHTVGDFVTSGVVNSFRNALIRAKSEDEVQIKTALAHVFGTQLINALGHDGPRRLEVPLAEVKDYVAGLKFLIERGTEAKLVKGVGP